jgi:hypothetical protein
MGDTFIPSVGMRSGAGIGEGQGIQRLVGAAGIVGVLAASQFTIELVDLQRARVDLIELFGMRAVGALDGAVEPTQLLADPKLGSIGLCAEART